MEKVIPDFIKAIAFSSYFKKVITSIFIGFLSLSALAQKTYSGANNGNWSLATNWTPTGVPTAAQTVTIPNNITVNVDANAFCSTLTLATGGNATTLNINAGIVLTASGAVTINIVNAGTANKTINVNAGTLICPSINLPNSNNNNRRSIINVTTGLLDVSGDITLSGSGVRSQLNITSSGKLELGGNIVSATTPNINLDGTSTVEMNGTFAQYVPFQITGFSSYGNLTIANTTTAITTGNDDFSVAGIFTINNGATVNMGTATLTAVGTTAGTGLLTTNNTGTTPIPAGKAWSFNVEYNATGASAQSIRQGTYTNLSVTGNSSGTRTATGAFDVTGTFTTNITGSGKIDLNNSTALRTFNIGNLSIIDGILDAGSGNNAGDAFNTTINLANNLFIANIGQLDNGSTSDYTNINYSGTAASFEVNNVTGYRYVITNLINNAYLTMLTDMPFYDLSSTTLSLNIAANATLDAVDKKITTPNLPAPYVSVNITGKFRTTNTSGFSLLANSAISNTNTPTINLIGTNSTIEYYGTGQTVTARTYSNLTNTNGTNAAAGGVVVNGILTVNTGSTLNMGTNQLTGSLTSTAGTGTLRTQNTTPLPIPTGKTWLPTVQYDGAAQTVVQGSYIGLITANTGTKTFAAGTITVAGDWTSSGGKVDLTTNAVTLNFNGSAAQTLTENGSDGGLGVFFKTVSFSGGGKKTMGGTGKFSVAGDGVLTMAGTTELASGDILYLKSLINQTASVAPIPTGASITGNVFAERFMRGNNDNARRGYRLMSSPVQSSATKYNVFNLKQSMYITGSPDGTLSPIDALSFDTSPNHNPTIYHYRESSAGPVTQFDYYGIGLPLNGNEFNIAEGMYLFYRGARTTLSAVGSINRFSTLVNPEDVTLSFKGKLNQGPYSPAISYTNSGSLNYDGFNLVGNPYASTIDLTLLNATGTTNKFYVLNPATKSFNIYDKTTPSASTGDATKYIASGQGFFIQALSAAATVPFTENVKVNQQLVTKLIPTTPNVLLMSTSPLAIETVPQVLKLSFASQTDVNAVDDISIIFSGEGKEKYDHLEDASDLGGNGTTFISSFSSDNIKLAINSLPSINKSTKVKLSVISTLSGNFNLVATGMNSLDTRLDAKLVDNFKTDTVKLASNPTYNFTIDRANAKTYEDGRFELIFSEKVSNVNTLLSFTGKAASKSVNLAWQINAAVKKVTFTLEKSTNGTTFTSLTNINSDGRTVYSYDDLSPAIGNNYYRLKQTDANNPVSYSNVINIKFDTFAIGGNKGYKIYPVPARNVLNVQLNDDYNGVIAIKIIDFFGRVIKKTSYDEGNFSIDVSKLNIGTYIIELSNKNKLIGRSTFLKL